MSTSSNDSSNCSSCSGLLYIAAHKAHSLCNPYNMSTATQERSCRVIAITNNKGGVCKTTTTVAVGAQLSEMGYKVLLVDLDPQANLTKHLIDPNAEFEIVLHTGDVLAGSATMQEAILAYSSSVEQAVDYTLHFVPASYLMDTYESALRKKPDMPNLLRKALRQVRPHYDFILLDCPPQMSTYTYVALVAADGFFVPSKPATFSFDGIKNVCEAAEGVRDQLNPGLQFLGVGIMTYNPRIASNAEKLAVSRIEEYVSTSYGPNYMLGNVRVDKTIEDAQSKGRIISETGLDTRVGRDYHELTTKLLEVLN